MIIQLSPVRMDEELRASCAGDVLTINGEDFDFGPLPEGGRLPGDAIGSAWFAGDVIRSGGDIHVTLRLPHGANPSAAVAFPETIVVSGSGSVELPQ